MVIYMIDKRKNYIRALVLAAAITSLAGNTMTVHGEETAENGVLFSTAGIGSMVKADKTDEEFIEAAREIQGGYGYTILGIANVENNLNIRAYPSEDGKLIGKLPKDAACDIKSVENGWALITSGEVEGYVSTDYLLTGVQAKKRAAEIIKLTATVTCDALKVRQQPSTSAEVITMVANGEELEVVSEEGEWVKVFLDADEVYVASEFVKVEEKLGTAITMTELLYGQGVSDVRVDLVQYAKQFLGNPYVWGGTSLTKGADCSGFVLKVFEKFGHNLPHSSRAQANCGTQITASEAKPGDLYFYSMNGVINHVAIYIGGGQVIHASSPSTGIKISKCNYRTPVKIVRVLVD